MSKAVSLEYLAQRWVDAESAVAELGPPTLPQIALTGLAAFNRGVDPCKSGCGPYASVVFVKLAQGVAAPAYWPIKSDPESPWRCAKFERRDVEILARQSLGANAVAFRFADEWRVFDSGLKRFIPLRRKPRKETQ